MENNLILIIILLGCLIASLVWKNVSDNKKANRDTNKFEDLIGARAIYAKQEEHLIKKMKQDANNYEATIAKLELDVQTLNSTIADLHRKLDTKKAK